MQIPASPDEITSDWLTSVLDKHDVLAHSIQSFTAERLGGEQGMTGQLVRLRIRYADEQAGHPGAF